MTKAQLRAKARRRAERNAIMAQGLPFVTRVDIEVTQVSQRIRKRVASNPVKYANRVW